MSTTAFGLGSKYFALYEVAGVGIQWRTISRSPVEGDDFNLGLSMTMLMVDAGVYGVLTWYIEAVHPGERRPHRTSPGLSWGLSQLWSSGRHVRPPAALVLPPAEVLLGLVLVRRQQNQAERDGGGPGWSHGPAQNR